MVQQQQQQLLQEQQQQQHHHHHHHTQHHPPSPLAAALRQCSATLPDHPVNLPLHLARRGSGGPAPPEAHGEEDAGAPAAGGALLEEAKQLGVLAGPLFVEGVAAISEQLVATACVGQLADASALAALILAESVYNVTGYSLVSGLASALETLCGQAYGAGSLQLLPVMLVRAQLVCLLAVLPTALCWGSGLMASALTLLGQEPAIAQPTSELLQLMVPALLLSIITETVIQYLLAQGAALPGMVVSLAGLASSPALNWGYVFVLGLGLRGAAFAFSSIQVLLVLLLLIYLQFRDFRHKKPDDGSESPPSMWHGFSVRQALEGWGSFLAFGLPCVLMVWLEWSVWELMIFWAGWLPDAEVAVAVMGLSTQISLLPWMLCYATGTATATRVAQSLGAGDAARGRRIFRLAYVLMLVLSAVLCSGMWLFRHPVVAALSRSPDIQQQLIVQLPVVVAGIVCDGQVAVMMGLLRASGRQGMSAAVNVCGYYVVGVPVAWLLGFKAGMGVLGLRLGLLSAVASQVVVLHGITAFSFDFDAEVARAKEMTAACDGAAGSDGGSDDDDDAEAGGLRQPLLQAGAEPAT